MSFRTKYVKLHIHCESDLLRTVICPSARRRCPISRPPILTQAQWDLWSDLTGESSDKPGYGVELAAVTSAEDVWTMLVDAFRAKPRAYSLSLADLGDCRISVTAKTSPNK